MHKNQRIFTKPLSDERLSKRGDEIINSMVENVSAVPHRMGKDHKERMGMSRFYNNDRVKLEELESQIVSSWSESYNKNEDLFIIQDSTDYNAIGHKGRMKGSDPDVGLLWKNNEKSEWGFFVHPGLVLAGSNGFPLGYSSLHMWNRTEDSLNRKERNYKRQPIEEKESYRWIETMERSRQCLEGHCGQVYHLMDREADIWELFIRPLQVNEHLVIRTNRDRIIYNQEGEKVKLWDHLQGQTPRAIVEIEIPRNGKIAKRLAKMGLYYERVELARPKDRTKAQGSDRFALTLVEVKELAESVPLGQEPVHWCIWTDLEINTVEEALEIVGIYKKRWNVEELFSLLKTKGLDSESAQMETGIALKKMVMLALQAALNIFQLIKDRDNKHEQPSSLLLEEQDLIFLEALIKSLEGKTELQKNPYPRKSLARLSWAVGRMGGYSGYKSQSPPGPKTMSQGWKNFIQQLKAWHLIRNMDSP